MADQDVTSLTSDDAERIRQQERAKLQGVISRLEAEVNQLRAQANPQDSLSQILAKVESALSSNRKTEMASELAEIKAALSTLAQSKEPNKTTPENQSELLSLKEEINTLKQSLQSLNTDYTAAMDQVKQSTRQLLILQAIKDAGRPLIEEMVTGNTAEEIQASVQKAIEVYDKYHKSESKTSQESIESGNLPENAGNTPVTPPANEEVITVPNPIGPGPVPMTAPTSEQIVANLQKMNAKERATYFAQNPDAMRKLAELDFQKALQSTSSGVGL